MPYTTAQGRQLLLDELAQATEKISLALANLGEAYEALDERSAERLEEELFGPAQLALGRAKRAHGAFAQRHGMPSHSFGSASAGAPSNGFKGFLQAAVQAIQASDNELAQLQDSMLPVEVGDGELRGDLREIRTLLDQLPGRAHQLLRTFGR
jgi:hypothetical protein